MLQDKNLNFLEGEEGRGKVQEGSLFLSATPDHRINSPATAEGMYLACFSNCLLRIKDCPGLGSCCLSRGHIVR